MPLLVSNFWSWKVAGSRSQLRDGCRRSTFDNGRLILVGLVVVLHLILMFHAVIVVHAVLSFLVLLCLFVVLHFIMLHAVVVLHAVVMFHLIWLGLLPLHAVTRLSEHGQRH